MAHGKRKSEAETGRRVKRKTQPPAVPQDRHSSSGLSSVPNSPGPDSPDVAPTRETTATGSVADTPEPDGRPAGKTSQKGVGMARTVAPPRPNEHIGRLAQPLSSPEMALAHREARQAEAAIAQQELLSRVKREDAEPDLSVEQMTGGVSIDAGDEASGDTALKERPAVTEERYGVIQFHAVSSSEPSPAALIILTGLKNIFQKQLPKMPREYIARLVFDRNHWSMAIVKRGLQVVGGITYRPFAQRGFGEIVFCAITGTEQVKGYGSHLMNHLKDYVREAHPGIEGFLTYADNYAIGYFKKQGFTKEITLDRKVWAGYIKDYEGGTIMQCSMLPRVRYLEVRAILARQREAIMAKVRQISRSHIVHSGRELFPAGVTSVDPSEVDALRELGWTPQMDELTRRPARHPQHNIMQRLLTDMQNQPSAWAFARPVNKAEVVDYYVHIKNPMDLETMETKLESNQYDSLDAFLADANWIFVNCRTYNAASSNYVKNADKLEQYLKERLRVYVEQAPDPEAEE